MVSGFSLTTMTRGVAAPWIMELDPAEQGAFQPISWSRVRTALGSTRLTRRQCVVSSAAPCAERQRAPAKGLVIHEAGDNLSQSKVSVDLPCRGPQLGHRS